MLVRDKEGVGEEQVGVRKVELMVCLVGVHGVCKCLDAPYLWFLIFFKGEEGGGWVSV